MKLRAYLVDDEPLALERLRRLLDRTERVEVIGSTTEPEQAVRALAEDPPDVCFLDIHMPRLTGFDVLARIPQQPIVVFTTAYEPEALGRALMKIERLRESGQSRQPNLQAVLKQLTDSLRDANPEYPDRIASRLGDRMRFLDLTEVTHFYAEDKLTYAVSEGKPHCVDYAITALEKKLDPNKFVRIHRSTIVNSSWIKEVTSLPGGALNIRLKDKQETDLTVARDRAREFKARVGC